MNNCLARPYTQTDWTHVAPLVEASSFKPRARYESWSQSTVLGLTREQVRNTLGKENSIGWVVFQQNQTRGFACLSMLPWDSEQLGTSAARVDCLLSMGSYNEQRRNKEILLDQLVSEAQDRRVRHLSARVDASDLSSLHVLEKADFITLDGILTYALSLAVNPSVELPGDFRVRLATVADAEETATLARTAFVYDRYHADPFITREQADELHAAWLRNSCTGEAADAVLVAEDQEGLLGFTSCSLPRDSERRSGRMVGTIILVASAQRARCRGVAHATMMAAVEWLRQQGCEIVESGTQLRNIPSSRLFRKCGFVLVGSSLSLRRLLSE